MLAAIALTTAAVAGTPSFYGVPPVAARPTALVGTTQLVHTPSNGTITSTVKRVTRFTLPAAKDGEAISALTFSFNNLFNSSTEGIGIDASSLNLWSGTWDPSPLDPPMSGEFPPLKPPPGQPGKLNYGFRAIVNPADPVNPNRINGSFMTHPDKCDAGCGNFSKGFAGYAFAMVELGNGGQEMVIESSGAVWDDLYSDEFGSMIGEQMVYTLVMRHRDCDPNGWSKCKACTCPEDPPPPSPQLRSTTAAAN